MFFLKKLLYYVKFLRPFLKDINLKIIIYIFFYYLIHNKAKNKKI